MAHNLNWWTRKLHRWGAVLTAVPLLLVIVSGLLLQVKKQVPWVQPPTIKGSVKNEVPTQTWDQLLAAASSVPEAEIQSWEDIDRIDVRPSKGIAKIQCSNRWELQVDLASGEVLSSTYRRSDFIESLHDGSFFSDDAKLWVFLPNGFVLFGLWLTGAWLWWIPIAAKRKKKLRAESST